MTGRLFQGFLYGALAPVGLACVAAVSYTIAIGTTSTSQSLFIALGVAIGTSAPISAMSVLLLGLPAYWLLSRYKWSSLTAYVAAGLLLTLVPSGLVHFG